MNQGHYRVVLQGGRAIAEWRQTTPNAKLELGGADLRGVNLCGADLCKADLRGADLREANLNGVDLIGADLREADLREADLRGADLYRADLGEADLRGANLCGVDLGGADLSGTDLSGANLDMASLCKADLRWTGGILAIGPGGSRKDMLYFVKHDNGLMVKTGCFWGNLAEFEAAIANTHGNTEYGRYYRATMAMAQAWAQA